MKSPADYEAKAPTYFAATRSDILQLLPASVGRVLEIGCGTGQSLRWVREERKCAWTEGIEMHAPSATVANEIADRVQCGDAEEIIANVPAQSFNTILCLDSLEHLVDPWAMVNRAFEILVPGGLLLVSVPNVRHFSVVLPLLFAGAFRYRESGILDSTHLRFFTRLSAREMLTGAGFEILKTTATGLNVGSKAWIVNAATVGILRRFLEFQIVMLARATIRIAALEDR
jgi:2-polyprenyl-3-methyl-5-hydroxy-6-metoxy-1,4-benzoquinol methylase